MKNKKISSPRREDKIFTKYWELFIEDVASRDNFKLGHLQQLEILCDLYVSYHDLSQIIKSDGYTFENEGRHGAQLKPHPCVALRYKTLAEIRQYSKMLGITLVKDQNSGDDEKGVWE